MNKFIFVLLSIFTLSQSFSSFEDQDQDLERKEQGWRKGRGSYIKDFPLDSLEVTFRDLDNRETTQVITSIQGTSFLDFYHPENKELKAVLFNKDGTEAKGFVVATMSDEDNIYRPLDSINPYAVTLDGKVYVRFEGLEPMHEYDLVK